MRINRFVCLSVLIAAGCADGVDASASGDTDGMETEDASGSSTSSDADTDPSDPTEASSSGTTSTTGGGSDSDSGGSTTDATTGVEDCSEGGAVFGRAYVDENGSDLSRYAGGYEDGIDSPVADFELQLFGETEPVMATCDDGLYGAPSLDDGVYLVAPTSLSATTACSQRNCPRRLPVALAEGRVKIVTIGDSVPVEGALVTFPERLAELMGGLADVEQINEAVSGTESSDWVPGSGLLQNVTDELDDTDVVVISLGGNDVLNFVSTVDLTNIGAAIAGAQETVDQVVVNVRAIATAVRQENPDVDIVYCVYPDYSQATSTYPWSDLAFLPPGVVSGLLARARDQITPEDDFVVVDLLEITDGLPVPLDDYLADPLHFNDAGHDLYAHEIFRSLGGVIVGPSPLASGETFENRHDYGLLE